MNKKLFILTSAVLLSFSSLFATDVETKGGSISGANGQIETATGGTSTIIDHLQEKGIKQVLAGVKNLKEGLIGMIVQMFVDTNSGWKWMLKEGELPEEVNASTKYTSEGVVTTIDTAKLLGATKLSVARTLLHELVHSFLTLYYRHDGLQAAIEYPLIASLWVLTNNPDYNSIQHVQMEESFVGEIALSLKEYAATIGISAEDRVYQDLAWGGLDFQNNQGLTAADKLRIKNRLLAEQLNSAIAAVLPVGPALGS